ncbi:integrase/recombinase XerD [Candidatus Nanopelagicus abundans]|uniref:Tyrosine recombinase XerC n=1 Tax=Candidatus Nanopelagicus abundans TaxID=1884916 RepID=A0A249L4C8_9ACTN|nr:site-specific tyrosine recombinase/integron integrase [Candidatus Nanopelagicus abundans]ASY23902.1 integrase/recombinase XerD [Candidatus Nanopelagicus abundans]
MASDHLADFFNYLSIEKGLASNTISAYRLDIEKFFHYLSTNQLSLENVTPEQLSSYVAWLRGMENREFKIGESSIARNIISIRSYFTYLAKEHKFNNPSSNFKPPKIGKRLPKALTIDQVMSMLNIAGTDLISSRDKALVELLYATGARVSELINLNTLDISTADTQAGTTTTVKLKGKGGKERVVPIGSFAVAAVNDYLVRSRPTLLKVSTQKALFLNQRGGRLSRQSAWNLVAKAAERAGLSDQVTPHSMRHSFATHLLDGGADIRVVQELLGHSSVTTTQIYTLITIDHLRESYANAHPRSKF